jgi:carboxylesterase type B
MHQITAYGGAKGPAPFQQAVPQSPGWQPTNSLVTQETTYNKFLSLTGAKSLAELRALSSEVVIRASAQQIIYDSPYGSYTYGPVVDGLFVPLQPGQLLAQGRFDKNVRVMVGYNADEGAVFMPTSVTTAAALKTRLEQSYANAPQSSIEYIVDKLYPPVFNGSLGYTNDYERGRLIVAESAFTCNAYYLSKAYGNETYAYLFAVPPALHGQDVQYTYYNGGGVSSSVTNVTIAIAMQQFITSFAETGVPDAIGVKEFKMYGPDANVLELNVTGIEEVRDSNANARCAWWQKALY